MAPKRDFHGDDGNDGWGGPPKKRPTFPDAVRDVMRGFSMDEIVTKMEPFLRRVVREELQCFVHNLPQSSRPSVNRIETSGGRGLQLRFEGKFPSTIFTGSRVETEDNCAVKVMLFDTSTNTIVSSGPLSSAKVELVVLNSEFGSDDQENWPENEFTGSILREREGKRPLITGELTISLKDGVGYIGDASFTDNSSWLRSRKFKLGARILQRISGEVRIREAASEAFVVKDHRGELYKKHHPPHLHDEVWRLERIAKDGAFHKRLAKFGIGTLKDFLQKYFVDQSQLRLFLGGGISNKTWETIIEHAKTCVVDDDKLYAYYRGTQQAGILLNSIYEIVGATFDDGQNYSSLNTLNFSQTLLVEDLKRQAYKNLNELVPIDDASVIGFSRPSTSLQAEPFMGPNLNLQHTDFPILQQETQVGFNDASASTSYANAIEPEDGGQLEVPVSQSFHPAQLFAPMMRNSFRMVDFSSGTCSGWSPSGQLGAEDICQVQTTAWSPAVTWGQGNGLFFASGNEAGIDFLSSLPNLGVHITRRRSQSGWCKIRAAIKWKISVRQGVAARKMASFMY